MASDGEGGLELVGAQVGEQTAHEARVVGFAGDVVVVRGLLLRGCCLGSAGFFVVCHPVVYFRWLAGRGWDSECGGRADCWLWALRADGSGGDGSDDGGLRRRAAAKTTSAHVFALASRVGGGGVQGLKVFAGLCSRSFEAADALHDSDDADVVEGAASVFAALDLGGGHGFDQGGVEVGLWGRGAGARRRRLRDGCRRVMGGQR